MDDLSVQLLHHQHSPAPFLYRQSEGGVVRQYDLSEGTENWQVGCDVVTGDPSCSLSVEAEFR